MNKFLLILLGIVGSNGIGKSTLLKIIQKKLPCSRGSIEWTKNIKISYFDQENSQLDFNKTVIDELHSRYRTMTEQSLRSLLGRVRLIGENVYKQVGVISGGERAKLCFALMMLERGNVLILDEPTNHLDISTKEILEEALCCYDGTVIFVSHDRYLLSKLATDIFEITENSAEMFDGGFENYMNIKRERRLDEEKSIEAARTDKAKAAAEEKSSKTYRTKEQRSAAAQKRNRIKELETAINNMEEEMKLLQAEMTSPEVCADYVMMNEKCAKYEELKKLSSDYSDEWVMLSDELEG